MLRAAGAQEARWLSADRSSVSGVSEGARAVLDWRCEIHGLVHSAMTVTTREVARRLSPDGLEWAFALQHLARAALNQALVGALAASGDGRIVHVGAVPLARLVPDLDDLQIERRKWSLMHSLMSSQVLGILHVQAAARRWRDTPVRLAIACVGPTKTDTLGEQAWWARALYAVIATTPERSAQNAVRYLLEDDVRAMSGVAFRDWKTFHATPIAYDEALAGRAWSLTEELLRAHAQGRAGVS